MNTTLTERPILFSGAMVRAILEGRKTKTRRVLPIAYKYDESLPRGKRWITTGAKGFFAEYEGGVYVMDREGDLDSPFDYCQFGQPGDRLWVRETTLISPANFVDERNGTHPGGRVVQYLATHPDREAAADFGVKKATPSIHMPRWASRITLEVTEVRVQRLQDISEEDTLAEGILVRGSCGPPNYSMTDKSYIGGNSVCETARDAFRALWDSINGKRPGASFESNPWVWAITFKRIKP